MAADSPWKLRIIMLVVVAVTLAAFFGFIALLVHRGDTVDKLSGSWRGDGGAGTQLVINSVKTTQGLPGVRGTSLVVTGTIEGRPVDATVELGNLLVWGVSVPVDAGGRSWTIMLDGSTGRPVVIADSGREILLSPSN